MNIFIIIGIARRKHFTYFTSFTTNLHLIYEQFKDTPGSFVMHFKRWAVMAFLPVSDRLN